jgi:hypothetical protein
VLLRLTFGLSPYCGNAALISFARQLTGVAFVGLAVSGCAHYRDVSVLVVSAKTRKPVAGVEVATLYVPKPFSLASRRQDKQRTGPHGIALLRANYLSREPTLLGLSADEFSPMFCLEEASHTTIVAPYGCAPRRLDADLRKHPTATFELTGTPASRGDQRIASGETCRQRSWIAQLGIDLGAVWATLISPFQQQSICGSVVEK